MQRVILAVMVGLLFANGAARAGEVDRQKVATAQTLLHLLGLYDGTTFGTLGPRTRKALADYQQKLGLPVTGQPDPRTLYALGNPGAVQTCRDTATAMAPCLDKVSAIRRFLSEGAPPAAEVKAAAEEAR